MIIQILYSKKYHQSGIQDCGLWQPRPSKCSNHNTIKIQLLYLVTPLGPWLPDTQTPLLLWDGLPLLLFTRKDVWGNEEILSPKWHCCCSHFSWVQWPTVYTRGRHQGENPCLVGSRYPTGKVNLKHLYLLPSRIHILVKLLDYKGVATEVQR